ncbi:MAG: hypothetical protein OXT67_09895 [Zetaproteobacteria bacterium]|nr:hypothetical protein [Zetaproteobacteria bacterium]
MDSVSVLVDNIEKSFQEQFSCGLDAEFFAHIIDKELAKKKEAFLQVQISNMGLDVSSLDEIKSYLVAKAEEQQEDTQNMDKSSSEFDGSLHTTATTPRNDLSAYCSKDSPYRYSGKKRGRRSKTGIQVEIDETGLSESEILKAKRREYARQYYARKKQSEAIVSEADGHSITKIPSKKSPSSYRTSEDQRRYQREYYRRKKAAAKAMENQMKLMKALSPQINTNHDILVGQPTPPISIGNSTDIPESKVQHPNDNLHHSLEASLATSHESSDKKPFVEYDKLVSDRLAIDNAFRFETSGADSIEFEALKKGETQTNQFGQTPRTKLRKSRGENDIHHP